MTERIGFIGLGIMGRGMVANLLQGRLRADGLEPHREPHGRVCGGRGASAAASPADVAGRCDIIIICVSDTPDVRGGDRWARAA